jgi:hypothetical protein
MCGAADESRLSTGHPEEMTRNEESNRGQRVAFAQGRSREKHPVGWQPVR